MSTVLTLEQLAADSGLSSNIKTPHNTVSHHTSLFNVLEKDKGTLLREKIYTELVEKYLANHRYNKVIETVKIALGQGMHNDRILLCAAIVYATRKCYSSAYQCFEKALMCNPDNLEIYFHRATLSISQKERDLNFALADFTEIINRSQKNAVVYYHRAFVWNQLKHYQQAVDDCMMAISLNDHCIEAYCTLAESYYQLARSEKIVAESQYRFYHMAIAACDVAITIYNSTQGTYKSSFNVAFLAASISTEPNLHNKMVLLPAYHFRGSAYMAIGKITDAAADFDTAIQLCPERRDFFINYFIGFFNEYIDNELQFNFQSETKSFISQRVDTFDSYLEVLNIKIQQSNNDRSESTKNRHNAAIEYIIYSVCKSVLLLHCRNTYQHRFLTPDEMDFLPEHIRIYNVVRHYIDAMGLLLNLYFSTETSKKSASDVIHPSLSLTALMRVGDTNKKSSTAMSRYVSHTMLLVDIIMGITHLYSESSFTVEFFAQKFDIELKERLKSYLLKSVPIIMLDKTAQPLRDYLHAHEDNIYSFFDIKVVNEATQLQQDISPDLRSLSRN